jgi:REP-associated tyrosine transposase
MTIPEDPPTPFSLGALASSPAPTSASPKPWRSRGYLPHFDQPRLVQFLTFRLHDAVPETVIESWKAELAWAEKLAASELREVALSKRISQYEDAGHGVCWLGDERIAALLENTLLQFDGQRYRLVAWCVMPNHVHAMIETSDGWPVAKVVQSWKSYTAHRANQILGRSGAFWFREYFDRFIRDDRHFVSAVKYVEQNPVKAGLVDAQEAWRWSSAWGQRG